MYQVRKKESKAKNVVIAILAIILALGAVGAVVGIGSKGFTQWDTSRWFKQEYGSRKVMGITKLSELEGIPYDVASDWTYVAEPLVYENEDGEGNVTEEKANFNVYMSVLNLNENIEFEAGTYNITVDVNGNEYEFKDIEIESLEDNDELLIKLDYNSEAEGEEINLFENQGKGFHVVIVHAGMFSYAEDSIVEHGDTLYIASTDKITHFEFVKIEKVK